MRKVLALAVAVAGVFGIVVASSSASAAPRATAAAKTCKATIAGMFPITGPAAQLGSEQLNFAKYAVKYFNKALGIHVTMNQNDTQLATNTGLAKVTQDSQSIIGNSANVAVVGPAGSQEVQTAGPLFGRAGIAFVSGSATRTTLTTSGADPTFFRVVAPDAVQGPQDARYIINHLHPKAVLVIDDEEAYSQGLIQVVDPILQAAGIKVNHQSYNGTDTGATLNNDLSALVNSQLNSSETVTFVPWQTAPNAQLFGQLAARAGKHTTMFGTDGTDSPTQFNLPGTYISNFGPSVAGIKNKVDEAIVKGVPAFPGASGSFGVPSFEATHVVMKAIATVCAAGKTPSRANVLAAMHKTYISGANNAFNAPIKFKHDGDIVGATFYLFKVNSHSKYVQISYSK
jgi:branched-chain amino acid transport system substrate-binding protein